MGRDGDGADHRRNRPPFPPTSRHLPSPLPTLPPHPLLTGGVTMRIGRRTKAGRRRLLGWAASVAPPPRLRLLSRIPLPLLPPLSPLLLLVW